MARLIRRYTEQQTYAVTNSASTTAEMVIEDFSQGEVFVPTGSGLITLTWHVAEKAGGTYLPAQDTSGSAVATTVSATKAYPVPAVLFGAAAIKAVGNTSGNIIVGFKS